LTVEPVSSRLGIGRATANGVLLPTLLFYYPEKEKRWKLEVQSDRFTIGRSREVEVCIPHTSVSKKHLLVERRGPKYIFRDLGSKNGSFLNDFRMARGSLSDGDELRVGSIRITFYKAAAPEEALEDAGVTGAPSPVTEQKPGEGTTTSSGPPPPSRAEQETAALPRRELSDRLKDPGTEAPLDPSPMEFEEILETTADPDIGADDEGWDTAAPSPERPRQRRAGRPAPVEEPPLAPAPGRTISAALLWGGALACVAAT
jgi:pSer/pThr/pTyr-binding forkhead associated (FHA) protein